MIKNEFIYFIYCNNYLNICFNSSLDDDVNSDPKSEDTGNAGSDETERSSGTIQIDLKPFKSEKLLPWKTNAKSC